MKHKRRPDYSEIDQKQLGPVLSYYVWDDLKTLLLHGVKMQNFKRLVGRITRNSNNKYKEYDNSVLYNYAKDFPKKIGLLNRKVVEALGPEALITGFSRAQITGGNACK